MIKAVFALIVLSLALITSCPDTFTDPEDQQASGKVKPMTDARRTLGVGSKGTPIATADDKTAHPVFSKMVGSLELEDLGMISNSPFAVGSPPPDFAFAHDGKVMSVSQLKGKPVLINVFASWCPPCNMEMPDIQAAYEKNKGKNLVIIAVSTDDGITEAKQFYSKYNLTMPVVPGSTAGMSIGMAYNVTGIPTSIFVDKEGKVVDIYPGMLDAGTLEEKIARIL